MHVVLYQPEIPPNTGNVIRLCANTGAHLHLIEPLGFTLDDANLRRAGLDYHALAWVRSWPDLDSFFAEIAPDRLLAFSTRGRVRHTDYAWRTEDALLFGPETRGLPQALLDGLPPEQRIRLPMAPGNRSLNLSNAVAVAVYEAWRQLDFAGAQQP
ncbi:MAG: tRNA (cytidine(34)-2'-O)-methyltransferase [Gammaproteobacteria bacterium]|jgi:tRNA (cytidine/uridine-2'-O-)-methyltransferase|nr:tRNA (cytidine(34)-2'-O)-methyltransferase [Gammaproteobacteria bacterium]